MQAQTKQAYFICDQEKQSFRAFVSALASLQGLSVDNLRSIPYWLASTIGRVMDVIWPMTRKDSDPPISRSMIHMIGRELSLNDAAARRKLGYVGRVSRADGLRSYAS